MYHPFLCLFVFYIPSTGRSFRDGTPFTVPCKGREAQLIHRTHRESNRGPLRGSPLLYRCATPALCWCVPSGTYNTTYGDRAPWVVHLFKLTFLLENKKICEDKCICINFTSHRLDIYKWFYEESALNFTLIYSTCCKFI